MSKMRKSLAVLSSAIAPILLANSSASAALNFLNIGQPSTNNQATSPLNWPNSTNGNAAPIISSGSSTSAIPGGPTNYVANQAITFNDTTSVVSETFTTGANGFPLGAISFQGSGSNGNGGDTTMGATISLFRLSSAYTPTSGFYTLGNGGSEVGNELLGVGGGQNGLTFNLPNGGQAIYEFDFTGADQVTLAPNTSYAVELQFIDPATQTPPAYLHVVSGPAQSYTGGQAYTAQYPGDNSIFADHSTVARTQALASPANLLFAVYPTVNQGPAYWYQTTSGNWGTGSDWSSNSIPSGIGVEADFLSPTSNVNAAFGPKTGLAAAGNVYTDTAQILGTMQFDNASGYVIDGAGSLTLQVASGSAAVNVVSGTQEINVPLTIASNTSFNVSTGATLKISDPMTINTGVSLTNNAGTGTVLYQSSVTVLGSGNITLAAPTVIHSLILSGSSATATVAPKGASVNLLQLDSISTVPGSSLDVSNNALILHGGPLLSVASQLGTAFTELKNGFNAPAGYWNGTNGIVSSTAATDSTHLTTLGFMQSTGGTFDGVSTTTNDVLVKYTYYGDANLDGSVNGADYIQIDHGFGLHLTGWQNGDFNYDGVVDGSDYSLIDNTDNQINARGLSPLALTAGPADLGSVSPADVPEPATLGLLGISAATVLLRRRRSV